MSCMVAVGDVLRVDVFEEDESDDVGGLFSQTFQWFIYVFALIHPHFSILALPAPAAPSFLVSGICFVAILF